MIRLFLAVSLPPSAILQMRIAHIGPLGPLARRAAPQFGSGGTRAFGQAHHDGVAIVGRASEPLANLGLLLEFDAAGREFPARRGEVGLDGSVGRQRQNGAAVLAGIEFLAHPPPRFGAFVEKFQLAVPRPRRRRADTPKADDRDPVILEARHGVAAPAAVHIDHHRAAVAAHRHHGGGDALPSRVS